MSQPRALSEWAQLLAESLAEAGVRHAVLSPGSRSTPFAWALLARPELECHAVLDERSAGFLALGLGKASGSPAVLLCTSGSAPAHYYPSVVEASTSATPLILLTADRPFELMDAGAPQTTDQVRLFGAHARHYVELGLPESTPDSQRGLRRRVHQAVVRSRWPWPGPVQINARARPPLEPVELGEAPSLASRHPRVFLPQRTPDPASIRYLAGECRRARRGVITCGAALPWQAVDARALHALAEIAGFSLWPETTSQLRHSPHTHHDSILCDGFELLLRAGCFEQAAPDCILHFGAPLIASGWQRLVKARPDIPRHAVAAWDWPDPDNTLTSLTIADPTLLVHGLVAELAGGSASLAWQRHLSTLSTLAWTASKRLADADWNEGRAVRTVVETLPPHSAFALGNSLALREVDRFASGRAIELVVISQRGNNGIDGLLSGALGAALAHRRPTTVLLGDLSFLHDVGALALAGSLAVPLAVVVLNNHGGRIFEELGVARCPSVARDFAAHWVHEHTVALADLGRAFGLVAHAVRDAQELGARLTQALATPACTLLEVLLPPRGPGKLMASIDEHLQKALAHSPFTEGGPS